MGFAPHSTFHPPTVTISTRAALTSSSSTTVARVACTTALSRLGCVMITPGSLERAGGVDIAAEDTCSRALGGRPHVPRRAAPRDTLCASRAGVVELVDTPALGAGGRKLLWVRVPPPASARWPYNRGR